MIRKCSSPKTHNPNHESAKPTECSKQRQHLGERVPLDTYLQLFEFKTPFPKKNETRTIQLFYNNCNSLEINKAIGEFFFVKRQQKAQKYIQNIELITKIDKLIRYMKQWKVDISCLSEVCIDWSESAPKIVTQELTKPYNQQACWTVSSSNIRVGSNFKPGGTATLCMNSCVGRIVERDTDPSKMGRWSYIKLRGSNNTSVIIVTSYRVGKRTGSPGPTTSWAQRSTILKATDRAQEPYAAFLKDLAKWLRKEQNKESDILINLDANEK